jgi:multidrug efflux pump subunit AcrB
VHSLSKALFDDGFVGHLNGLPHILGELPAWQFSRAPTGFIPDLDQGYLITVLQLPPGSSLARTDEVTRKVTIS